MPFPAMAADHKLSADPVSPKQPAVDAEDLSAIKLGNVKVADEEKEMLRMSVTSMDKFNDNETAALKAAPPRKTHMLITEGHRRTQNIMILGFLGLLVVLAANFGLSALAVFLQKDVYVGNSEAGATLADTQGNPLSMALAEFDEDLFDLPRAGTSYLSGLKHLEMTTDQGSHHIFFVSHVKYQKQPGNTDTYRFSITSKAGHALTWSRPLVRDAEGVYQYADETAAGISITHPLEVEAETVGTAEGRRLGWAKRRAKSWLKKKCTLSDRC